MARSADDLRDFGDWSRCAGLTEARDLRKERDLPVNVRVCFQSLQGILKFHDLPPNLAKSLAASDEFTVASPYEMNKLKVL